MNDVERETPVIFTWADREGSSWWLAAFIFLSFLLHSAAFFIFHGKDPLAPRAIRTAPLVQVLSPAGDAATRTAESSALLDWIATHDPALVAKVQIVEPKGLLDVPYRPSFNTVRTQPLGAPPEPPTIQIPPAHDPLALIRSLIPSEKIMPAAPAPQPTRVAFSTSLEPRADKAPALTPRARTTVSVQPTTVLAGVDAEGGVRFAFIQDACGDKALDTEALNFVQSLRFTPSSGALQWGTVTVIWGDDIVASAPQK